MTLLETIKEQEEEFDLIPFRNDRFNALTRSDLLDYSERLKKHLRTSTISILEKEIEILEARKVPDEMASPNDDAVGSEQRAFGRNKLLDELISERKEVIKKLK